MIPVGIFAKPPYAGMVKTRLIPDIGATKAARVYRYCVEHTLDVARLSGLDYHVFLSEECDDRIFHEEQHSIQRGPDLGKRMLNALKELLAGNPDGALITGTDCLDLSAMHLRQAAQALANHELVLLPAADGGFALIGCTEANPALFRSVSWSSAKVLKQTLSNARKLNYRVSLLETVRDIDTLPDLEQYPELLALVASS
ncbi:MAG: TIGR04282 family arsenosugar biosynthesis glycosyltransferase [Gammaproteobacteria bacterium]|nr:TIGR04282 family arsenosugar biosynthesis glycosyltransferase [Gammaproteobacteria bacterium]MDH3534197.1 TIGR04282 family arsenosugar biosynthesis glycosyltransferase [Gammaproteobacteria bacterium]